MVDVAAPRCQLRLRPSTAVGSAPFVGIIIDIIMVYGLLASAVFVTTPVQNRSAPVRPYVCRPHRQPAHARRPIDSLARSVNQRRRHILPVLIDSSLHGPPASSMTESSHIMHHASYKMWPTSRPCRWLHHNWAIGRVPRAAGELSRVTGRHVCSVQQYGWVSKYPRSNPNAWLAFRTAMIGTVSVLR